MTTPIPPSPPVGTLPDVIARIQRALDLGPTDGPWYVYEAEGDATAHGISSEEGHAVSWWSEAREEGITKLEDAVYIASCNPENMRVLLSALSAHEAEVGRLTQELNVASVGEFGAQSANRHLSALVDFERQVSERCMAVMKALMDAAEPVNNEFQDCHIDYADYAKFVDAHAELLYVIKNGERPAALTQGEKS